ncbi:hypothetical protein OGAPHI_003934 [Ogataea philodendri]|uniref:Secreted protein n=1 Tax=Ogataea philodendri TaxID=1378263 RepID=A0A9P8T4H8_9ASCO|nr:uncharacterized protein OGAPHI_003934 [Ogataea philodendri]KAH3665746.1 hypothetical protein OGAPHI_003934 [Ogataea philodendri]
MNQWPLASRTPLLTLSLKIISSSCAGHWCSSTFAGFGYADWSISIQRNIPESGKFHEHSDLSRYLLNASSKMPRLFR